MKPSKLHALALFAVVAIGLLTVSITWSNVASVKDLSEKMFPPTPEAENVPLYPGAKVEPTEPRYIGPHATTTTFTAPASLTEVATFYNDTLQKQGWVYGNDFGSDRSRVFVWSDKTGAAPYGLYLSIFLVEEWNSAQNKKQVYGVMWLTRLPDKYKVPLYADARQVEVKEDSSDPITKYVTSAKPSEVEQYYKTILPQYGWYSPTMTNTDISKGIVFGFRVGGPVAGLRVASVMVIANQSSDGQTEVELQARSSYSLVRNDP